MTYVVVDFETASCADLVKVGAWRYAQDVSTWLLCFGYQTVTSQVTSPVVVLDEPAIISLHVGLLGLVNDPDVMFVAHNAQFEQAIWKHIMVRRYGWPELPLHRWHDTMAVAAQRTLPLSLDRVGRALNLSAQKDKEGHALMMQMCKPDRLTGNFKHDPARMLRLLQYNIGDVESQLALHRKLGGLGAAARQTWLLNERANQRGVLVDREYVGHCIALLDRARGPLDAEFRALTGFAPTQRAKILEWVQAQGFALNDLKKATLDAMLDPATDIDGDFEFTPEVYRVIELRRMLASSSVAKLQRMLDTCCYDGRVRGTMQFHGARTGRVAGRLIQPQNMPKPTVADLSQQDIMALVRTGNMIEIERQCGNVFDAVISTLRGCLKPASGNVFVTGDLNAIEARIVLALSGETVRAASFDTGDPYSDMAATIFDRPVNKHDHAELRFVGKGTVLGAGFGMGHKKFHAFTVPGKSLNFAKQCIDTYRQEFAPLVPKLWTGLETASSKAVWCTAKRAYSYCGITYQLKGDYLACQLPSEREIFYYLPKREQKAVPWDASDIRQAWSYLSSQGGTVFRKHPFGGLLAENVCQAIAFDIMVTGWQRAENNGLDVVFTVHDELVAETLASRANALETLQQCMEERDDWVKACNIPVRAECKMITEYEK